MEDLHTNQMPAFLLNPDFLTFLTTPQEQDEVGAHMPGDEIQASGRWRLTFSLLVKSETGLDDSSKSVSLVLSRFVWICDG